MARKRKVYKSKITDKPITSNERASELGAKPGRPVMKYGKLHMIPFKKDTLGRPAKRAPKLKRMPPAKSIP